MDSGTRISSREPYFSPSMAELDETELKLSILNALTAEAIKAGELEVGDNEEDLSVTLYNTESPQGRREYSRIVPFKTIRHYNLKELYTFLNYMQTKNYSIFHGIRDHLSGKLLDAAYSVEANNDTDENAPNVNELKKNMVKMMQGKEVKNVESDFKQFIIKASQRFVVEQEMPSLESKSGSKSTKQSKVSLAEHAIASEEKRKALIDIHMKYKALIKREQLLIENEKQDASKEKKAEVERERKKLDEEFKELMNEVKKFDEKRFEQRKEDVKKSGQSTSIKNK